GWAVQLPAAAAAGVGVAMLAAAGIAKAFTGDGADYVGAGSPEVRRGTVQARLVDRLASAAERLAAMVPSFAGTALGSSVIEASTGAAAAVDSARRLASAIDAIDNALEAAASTLRADTGWSPRSSQSRSEREAVVRRLTERRELLLSRIEAAYLGAEEVRAKLLEVSAAMQTPSLDPAADSGLAEVSQNLETLRQGLAELETAASASGLPDRLDRPPS
ncbi:MAG: hypothetical protein L0Y54_04080, partial [Sporichthyaceae bacterium]|nr:hypothetical protein [Sporichthyaceae bacterium]